MSSEKQRLILFSVLALGLITGTQLLMDYLGLNPKPVPPVARVEPPKADPAAPKADDPAAKPDPAAPKAEAPKAADAPRAADAPPAEVKAPAVKVEDPAALVIGSAADKTPAGYRLEVRVDQRGAGVAQVRSSRHEAEYVDGKAVKKPLSLIEPEPKAPTSMGIRLLTPNEANDPEPLVPTPLDLRPWEVVADAKGRLVRPVFAPGADPAKAEEVGQEIVLRTSNPAPEPLTVTKTYRLEKGADGFTVTIEFSGVEATRKIAYALTGPHGIPIEGEWYTGTFRDVYFGTLATSGATSIETHAASDVYKNRNDPYRSTALPLKFGGSENQYFAVFAAVEPAPLSQEERRDVEALAMVASPNEAAPQKSDVTVEIRTRSFDVAPDKPVVHAYRVYAGPKTAEALTPYGAADLATYRKNAYFTIPGGAFIAKNIIDPLLKRIYAFTVQVGRLFGGKSGNYGVAIILLTMTVRMIMFPLGRKAAMAAQRMQLLQPQLKAMQEKYKEDKEKLTKETFALYKREGVNPVGGCLPALVQLPIFVGLWQALNNSVALRHSQFLWIKDLAAPDMLFRFPGELPFLGQYFNVLPLVVVSLMLVQTKLFAPPATTPEQEQQQSIMKYMMIFMAVMFYKVPSGLGLYFITSSTWQICERLLLPKAKPAPASAVVSVDDVGVEKGPAGGKDGDGEAKPVRFSGLRARFEKLLDEAQRETTIRNDRREGNGNANGNGNGNGDPGKGKGNPPRPRPGGKRR